MPIKSIMTIGYHRSSDVSDVTDNRIGRVEHVPRAKLILLLLYPINLFPLLCVDSSFWLTNLENSKMIVKRLFF